MAQSKREREIRALIVKIGLTIEREEHKGAIWKAWLRAPNGQVHLFTFAISASTDVRSLKNAEADMKRFARENYQHAPTAMEAALAPVITRVITRPAPPPPPHVPDPKEWAEVVPVSPTPPAPPAQPEPEQSMPDTPNTTPAQPELTRQQKAAQSRLSQAQFFKVCMWAQSLPPEGKRLTYQQFAEQASKAMGFTVSYSTVAGILEATGVKLEPPPQSRQPGTYRDRVHSLARVLAEFMTKMGEPVPPDLQSILRRTGGTDEQQ